MTITREQWDDMKRHVEAAKSGGARVLSNMSLVSKALDALQPTEPPPTTSAMLGVTPAQAPKGEPDWRAQNMAAMDALFGPQGIRRTFQRGIPSSIAESYAGPDVGKRASWVSIKSPWAAVARGDYDAALRSYLATVPADHPLMLTYSHEPENDGGNAADFRAGSVHFNEVAKAARPQTLLGPILMDWTFDPGSGRTPADWTPGGDYDFMGIDTYQTYLFPPSGSPTQWMFAPTARQQAALAHIQSIGVAPAIGEFACGSWRGASGSGPDDFARKVEWIDTTLRLWEDAGALAVCYFNTEVNNDMSPNSLLEDDPASTEYWQTVTASHPAGKV